MEQKDALSAKLRYSLRSILRQFRLNPQAAAAIRGEYQDRSSECGHLIDLLNELRRYGKEKLATSKQEEEDRETVLTELLHREEKAMTEIKRLEEELNAAVQKKEEQVNEKKGIIKGLETELQLVKKSSEENDRRVSAEASKLETNERKSHETRKSNFELEIVQLKKKLADNQVVHRESELQLRKRKFKVENELENWIREYDNDMGERQDEIEQVQKVYDEQKTQLEELEERFKTLEEEYNQVVEDRRIAKEKKDEAEREFNAMVRAAIMLQSLWRSYRCRKMLKQKQKKGKKGKKSGKKGGKKKKK
jgi:chromosome segregation ATPase